MLFLSFLTITMMYYHQQCNFFYYCTSFTLVAPPGTISTIIQRKTSSTIAISRTAEDQQRRKHQKSPSLTLSMVQSSTSFSSSVRSSNSTSSNSAIDHWGSSVNDISQQNLDIANLLNSNLQQRTRRRSIQKQQQKQQQQQQQQQQPSQSSITELSSTATSSTLVTSTNQIQTQDDITYNNQQQQQQQQQYTNGLLTIGFITILFASNSPVLHAAYSSIIGGDTTVSNIPVLLLNAACCIVAMITMIIANTIQYYQQQQQPQQSTHKSPPESSSSSMLFSNEPQMFDSFLSKTSMIASKSSSSSFSSSDFDLSYDTLQLKGKYIFNDIISKVPTLSNTNNVGGGIELGLWKFIGTTLNIYGLSLTSAGHGAFLIQLTTLFVPIVQSMTGTSIPKKLWYSIILSLVGVIVFTTSSSTLSLSLSADVTSSDMILTGDIACIGAAIFYATYDLRLYKWGKIIEPIQLITTKIITQTILSIIAVVLFASIESIEFIQQQLQMLTIDTVDSGNNNSTLVLLGFVIVWSGFVVNTIAPYLQVSGQQIVGPAKAQVLYSTQPLWAALLSYIFLQETISEQGLLGSLLFLIAVVVAATTPATTIPPPVTGKISRTEPIPATTIVSSIDNRYHY